VSYEIREVDSLLNRHILEEFNALNPAFPDLQDRHFKNGFWWLAILSDHPDAVGEVEAAVAFAGLVPMTPFHGVGYLKRCFVMPGHHGHGLQYRMMMARELKARQLGLTVLVSECAADNSYSAANFRKAGFDPCEPEQVWGEPGSLFWVKSL
jgi:GNAT superfamily N-acetyltransferase